MRPFTYWIFFEYAESIVRRLKEKRGLRYPRDNERFSPLKGLTI
jgi:hypothetical protein